MAYGCMLHKDEKIHIQCCPRGLPMSLKLFIKMPKMKDHPRIISILMIFVFSPSPKSMVQGSSIGCSTWGWKMTWICGIRPLSPDDDWCHDCCCNAIFCKDIQIWRTQIILFWAFWDAGGLFSALCAWYCGLIDEIPQVLT